MSNFPCSLTRNITSHSMENLAFPGAFHSGACSDDKLLYYQFSLHNLYIFSINCGQDVLFELGSERVEFAKPHSWVWVCL